MPTCLGGVVHKGHVGDGGRHPGLRHLPPGVSPRRGARRGPLRAALRDPELTYRYLADDLAWAELAAPPGGSVDELIYGTRGLALLVARDAGGTASVIRVRGFVPMPPARYLDEYVRLRPEPLE